MKLILVLLLSVGYSFAADKLVKVKMVTSVGEIELELNQTKAPKTVENFLKYVDAKYYDGLIFHRVIKNFMIQGGGFSKDMKQKETKAPIINEAKNGLANDNGTIAMARTSNPNSATSQFFINTKDNAFLNYSTGNAGYAVFGKVSKGMSVVKQIEQKATTKKGMYRDVPVEPIVIKSIRKI